MNKYVLKRGAFLRQFGLPPLCEGTLRNNDELAEKYLANDPTLVRYFDAVPGKREFVPPPVSVKPSEPIEVIEPKEEDIPVEIIKAVRKPGKRAKTKK